MTFKSILKKVLAALGVFLLFAGPELAYFAGSMAVRKPPLLGICAVVVLGFPTKDDGNPHPVQRFRMDTAIKAYLHNDCKRMVISGAAVRNQWVEAETMAKLARAEGIPLKRIVLEKKASNTWENIKFAIPQVQTFDRIFIVSDALHVHRGRRYLCLQRPDLCERSYRYTQYRLGRQFFLKYFSTFHEGMAFARDLARRKAKPPKAAEAQKKKTKAKKKRRKKKK